MNYDAFLYAILAGLIPAFIWLTFWLHEDIEHPEPRWLIAGAFLAGALSVIVAIFAEKYISDAVANETGRYTLWAAVEEIIKFGTVGMVALRTRWNDEPIDAMIYAITVALGFSAIENTLFVLSPLSNGEITQSIVTGSMRFVGATLVHIVSSATVGFALGLAFYRGRIFKIVSGTLGLITAIALHAGFNLSIISSSPSDTLKSFLWIWIAVVILMILFEEVKAVRPKLIV
ncbi:MAG: PrsW family intramembrane metalloprotease [Patescibacteria group bacterium]|nr:PrsW family intramembrane metalloprotease [Patescibacteria group bacterium]MDE2232822.1 PrsW family intramembrane metalloprotease [Patescibacteria group bacterium]